MLAKQIVAFAGSRRLGVAPALERAVRAVLGSGRHVAVGCACGADAQVIRVALRLGLASRLVVFAVGGPQGQGFWRGSCFSLVRRAQAAGAEVRWWAGGACSCSGQCSCLRSRLRSRTLRLVRSASALVAFPLGGPRVSPGTWLAIRSALGRRIPVRVFPKGLKRLPKWHGRYEIEWQRGHLKWNGREWVVAGACFWAESFQPELYPAEPTDEQLAHKRRAEEESRWVWEMLQFDSLRSEAEVYEAEWDLEPGEETASGPEGWSGGTDPAFELEDDDEVLSDGALHRTGRWWIPGWVHQVEREVFGRALS